ncbi:DinB family protein [Galbibacter sp. EGI 63066]|uniref:DinB family protein n=1 Tax=Galbibacter sp. EGI 63066 TaxID=2993559 RepID=UPI0022488B15|nr:DinB family protein [Galbibacter sp. EGI 63066]MCX2680037.1 DinB family protein [Galbibacter sp. EGI 63066]
MSTTKRAIVHYNHTKQHQKQQMKYTPKDGFPYYFDFVKDTDCQQLFSSLSSFIFLNSINEEKAAYRYAPDKWSIKQIVGHITDHERIKIFRAFLMSRNELVQLWGYDQNFLVDNSRFEELTLQQLVTDFLNVRKASISFVESLSENQLKIKGWANQYEVTLEDFLKSIIGHEIHHINIIKERYL